MEMNFTRIAYMASLLIVGLGLAVTPHSNAALLLNGTNSYGTMSQSFLNGATVTNFTIEFWVKNKRPEINQNLLEKVEYWKEWMIGFYAGGNIQFYHAWPNSYYGLATTNGVVNSNQWQHVAIVGQGTLGSIYVNGVLVDQENTLRGQISFNAAVSGSTIAPFVLGFRDNATLPDDLWFQGDLADLRIWDIALSGSQVASFYRTPPAANTSGLRHWIPFNEGTGSTFTDIIGGLQGQLFNIAWGPGPLPNVSLLKAVKPSFSELWVGTNYQLQVSGNLSTWTNQGTPFTATNTSMVFPQYWDVANWNSLYFRLQVSP